VNCVRRQREEESSMSGRSHSSNGWCQATSGAESIRYPRWSIVYVAPLSGLLASRTNSTTRCIRPLPYRENLAAAVRIARIVASRYVSVQLPQQCLSCLLTSRSVMKYDQPARNVANQIESVPDIQMSSF